MVSPDNSTPHFSRRKILQFAGLAAGVATFPTACKSLTTSAEGGNAAAEVVNPARASNRQISRVVLIKTEDRVAGTRKATASQLRRTRPTATGWDCRKDCFSQAQLQHG